MCCYCSEQLVERKEVDGPVGWLAGQVSQHSACELEVLVLPNTTSGQHKFKILALAASPNPSTDATTGVHSNPGAEQWAEERAEEE